MKKLYLAGVLSLLILTTTFLAGCTNSEMNKTSDKASSQENSQLKDDTGNQSNAHLSSQNDDSSVSKPNADTFFVPGTWESDRGQYYFFDADGASGRTASLEDGTGVGFSYTVDGTQATFSWGGADNNSKCTVSTENTMLILKWEDGVTEKLIYAADEGSDSFEFYTNKELADLALAYYKAQNSDEDTSGLEAATQTNDDGSVSIQLYQNVGGHNSTADWYKVDRITATGTNAAGSDVCLAPQS